MPLARSAVPPYDVASTAYCKPLGYSMSRFIWQFLRLSVMGKRGPIVTVIGSKASTVLESKSLALVHDDRMNQINLLLLRLINPISDPWGQPVPPYATPLRTTLDRSNDCDDTSAGTLIAASKMV